jgi:DNA-binding GntR family transcriptional regulator
VNGPGGKSGQDAPLRADERASSIASAIRHDIIFGRFRARERLLEGELSERFDAGRHVIRAALEELERMEMVVRRPGRGAVVADHTPQEIAQLYEMREILQREAASRIPLPAPEDLVRRLRQLNDDFSRSVRSGRLAEASEINDRFHSTLFSACGNPYLASSIQQYWIKTSAMHSYAIGSPGSAERSHSEHLGILEAAEKGDRALLIQRCLDHMQPALRAYLDAQRAFDVGPN